VGLPQARRKVVLLKGSDEDRGDQPVAEQEAPPSPAGSSGSRRFVLRYLTPTLPSRPPAQSLHQCQLWLGTKAVDVASLHAKLDLILERLDNTDNAMREILRSLLARSPPRFLAFCTFEVLALGKAWSVRGV
jgi:hypothetical protein